MNNIKIADKSDLQAILELQYLAYQSEAELVGDTNIPPLTQTISDTESDFNKGIILKLVADEKNIGSVRGFEENGTVYVGKLMVHPEHQKKGYGTVFLKEIEKYFDAYRFELFTSTMSESNIRLYEKNGYKIFKTENISEKLTFVYLEKLIGK